MEKYFEILKHCSLFSGIEEEDIPGLLKCLGARTVHYKKGEMILSEGDAPKEIGIVLSGEVQVIRIDYGGNRSIVADIGEGELFGETFSCADIRHIPVDAVAKKDTAVLFADCKRMTQSCPNACAFHRQLVYNLMRIIASKNLIFHQKIEVISKRTTRERLLAYLRILAKKNNADTVTVPYDRQALADYLEVDRSGLSAEIGKLCREGFIENERNKFKLL